MQVGAADRLRAAGHQVTIPDLYAGEVATTLDEGYALNERIGWPVVERRARDAVRALPADTVLAGFSMGAAVVDTLLPDQPDTAGVLLLHTQAEIPATPGSAYRCNSTWPTRTRSCRIRPAGTRERPAPARRSSPTRQPATSPSMPTCPTTYERAAALTWQRVLEFLRTVRTTPHR